MNCPNCNTELPDNARFCHQCGTPVGPVDDKVGDTGEIGPVAADETAVIDGGTDRTVAVGTLPDETVVVPPAEATTVIEGADETTVIPGEFHRGEPVVKKGETTVIKGAAEKAVGADVFNTGVFDTAQFATVIEGPADTAADLPPIFVETVQKEKRPDEGKRKLVPLVAVGLVVACVIVAFVTWRLEFWGGKTLPDVVGETPSEATAQLEKLGFKVATKDVVTDTGVGTVLSMDPEADKRVDSGTTVTLSVGIERTVPDLEGMTVDEAKQALSDRGIDHVRLEYQNSSAPEGTVIATSPAEGAVVTSTQVVTLVVAQPFTVPDVVGLQEDEAKDVVSRSGLTATVTYVASSEASGTVLSTDPVAGTVLEEGGTVTLRVSSPYPSTIFSVEDYFDAKPEDISQYLKDQGYKVSYGTSDKGSAVMLWTGAAASPTVMITPNPFNTVGGFQLFPVDALSSGATIAGVRLDFTQESMPADAGTLAPTKDCVARIMNACGLVSTQGATTTSSNTTVVPESLRTQDVTFVVSASTMDDLTWVVCVYQKTGEEAKATVLALPTDSVNDALQADRASLDTYDNSLANYAAAKICLEK